MLRVAERLILEKGLDQTTVERIARTCGQSKGAFYWHFRSKEDCVREIVEAHAASLGMAMVEASMAGASARERLLGISDFRNYPTGQFKGFVTFYNRLLYSGSKAVRGMAIEFLRQWLGIGYETVRRLAKEAARDSGWTEEQTARFDFDAWAFSYLSCYVGIYMSLQEGHLPQPDQEALAETIHAAFIHRFLRKPAVEGAQMETRAMGADA